MYMKNIISSRISWLLDKENSSLSGFFEIPKAIKFLISIDAEARNFFPFTKINRVLAYFWWNKIQDKNKKIGQLKWELSLREKQFLEGVSIESWKADFKKSLHQYLQFEKKLLPVVDDNFDSFFPLVCFEDGHYSLNIPGEFFFLLGCRDDLQAAFDLSRFSGLYAMIQWWVSDGESLYAKLSISSDNLLKDLNELAVVNEFYSLPLFLNFILAERDDLKNAFDLNTLPGLFGFIEWWENYGKSIYPLLVWNTKETLKDLNKTIDNENGLKIPIFVSLILKERVDIRDVFDLSCITGLSGFITWWQQYGKNDYSKLHLDINKLGLLTPILQDGRYIPFAVNAILRSRQDLLNAFTQDDLVSYKELVIWWNAHGRHEYSLFNMLLLELGENKDIIVINSPFHKPEGINIVGFPQGTLGLGEDARLAGQVIESLGLDGVYINAPIPGPAKTVMPEGKLPIVEDCRFSTTLFCLPPTEMIRLAIEGGQHLIENDEYKIGAWPWELPHWPASFARVRDFVDEIWAQSEYVKDCFLKEGHTPVHKMPMAVTIPQPDADLREQLGITDNSFVYYLMFDGNSWLSRKNPIAGVLAFQQAFAASSEYQNVRLLIKAMNINANDPMWQKIVHMANQDNRIIIITERMDRQTLINMMNACDCYISLHRSEGFGRVIAEAMLLGQPVVATNFSGNIDFCKKDTAFLVDGDLLPLQQGDYIFFEGQYWCDPDIDTAATQLLKIYEDKLLRQKVALSGQSLIQQNYSVSAVAAFYSERFQEISKYNGYKP